MCTASASLTVWAGSWLTHASAPDDVLEALHAWAPMHLVAAADPVTAGRTGLPWPQARDARVMALLKTIREAAAAPGARIRLVLPVPGDVRGLPAGSSFAAAAIAAGEGLLVGSPGSDGTGLVPVRDGRDVLRWTAFTAIVPAADVLETRLGEAEFSMRETVRDAADALARMASVAVGTSVPDPRAAVEAQLAQYAHYRYPDSMPTRARRILDTADHVDAILTVAQRTPASTPASASGTGMRDDLLRPLRDAIRAARLVAVNAAP